MAMAMAVTGALVLIMIGYKAAGKGLVLGALFSAVNFAVMGEMLPSRIGREKRQAFFFSLVSILFRYGLMAVPLIISIKSDQFHVAATIAGLFMVQVAIVGEHVWRAFGSDKQKEG